MRSFWALPLRRQLVIAILLLLVPVLVAAIWSGVSTFQERRAELGEQARVVALTTAAYINRDLSNQDLLAERLSMDPAVRTRDAAATHDLFTRVTVGRAPVLRLSLVSTDGRTIAKLDLTRESLDDGT